MIPSNLRLLFLLFFIGCSPRGYDKELKEEISLTYKFIGNGITDFEFEEMQGVFGNYFIIKKVEPVFGVSNGVEIRLQDDYGYTIFLESSDVGFSAQSYDSAWRIVNKDSFQINMTYSTYEKADIYSRKSYKLLNVVNKQIEDTLRFGLIKFIDSAYSDTNIHYFDRRFAKMKFSIDKYLDSLTSSKCMKKRMLYYYKIKGGPNFGEIYKELYVEMKVGKFFRNTEVDSLIQIFNRESKKM